jgi:hypothetical protein
MSVASSEARSRTASAASTGSILIDSYISSPLHRSSDCHAGALRGRRIVRAKNPVAYTRHRSGLRARSALRCRARCHRFEMLHRPRGCCCGKTALTDGEGRTPHRRLAAHRARAHPSRSQRGVGAGFTRDLQHVSTRGAGGPAQNGAYLWQLLGNLRAIARTILSSTTKFRLGTVVAQRSIPAREVLARAR